MKKLMSQVRWATAAALTVSLGAFAQAPVKIGFVTELSGPQAGLGQDQYDGFMLHVERNGGKLGGVPVQVFKEDSQLKPEVAVQIVRRLIDQEQVSIIAGMTFSNIMMAVHKPVTDRGVFLVGTNGGPSPIAGAQCSPYQFMTSFQGDATAESHAQYANERGWKRMYLMAPNYQAGKDFISGFKRKFKGEVVNEVYTPLNQPDFSAELTQLGAARPDAVFVFYPGGLGINFVRQYAQAGLSKSIPLLSIGSIDAGNLPAIRDAAIGVLNGAPWGPEVDNPANRAFVEAFEAKHKRPATLAAALAYDGAQLIGSALAKTAGDVNNKPAFMAAMKAADFKSVRGNFRFGNNNFPIQNYIVEEGYKNAEGRVTLKVVATPLKDYTDSYAHLCPLK